MVKFGRHLQFYLESDETNTPGDEPFIVPYTEIREYIGQSQLQFTRQWMSSLKQASDDYSQRIKSLWKRMFDDLFSPSTSRRTRSNDSGFSTFEEDHRGIQSEKVFELYVSTMDEYRSRELFACIKKLHSTAVMNCEALRKLVKKFDKGAMARGDELLTSSLLQELYSASFSNYQCLQGYINILRDSLVVSEGDDEDTENDMYSGQQSSIFSHSNESIAVKRRAEELTWLKNMLASIPSIELSALVAHRGFHCPRDGTNKRPMENSIAAFEMAWCGGIHLCECDVALTKDEKLVLGHDDDFSRLALDPSSSCSKKKIRDLTMKEIISLTIKSGSRPPLLIDVLRSAQAIGGESRLVIEIKPGNQEACTALVRLFHRHPDLIDRCAVIMSFDAFTMHRLKGELEEMASFLMTNGTGSISPSRSNNTLVHNHHNDPPEELNGFNNEYRKNVTTRNRLLPKIHLPKILLLTVAKEPQQHYELWVDISNLAPVYSWLKNANSASLDGVYLQFQNEMLEQDGMQQLKDLSKQYRVGIWGEFGKDPDDYFTAIQLIRECGVCYVNTDLPRNFRGGSSRVLNGAFSN